MPRSGLLPTRSRLPRDLSPILALVLLVSVGCRDDSEPTAPVAAPALAATVGALSFRQVSAGSSHTCGVTTGNRMYCWGLNWKGELGDGTTTDRLKPVPVGGALRFVQVSVSLQHSCGLTVDSLAYCWGANDAGGLGDGTFTDHSTPMAVYGGRRFRQLSAGDNYTCGITTAYEIFCWGTGGGRGDELGANQQAFPYQLGAGLPFRDVSAALATVIGAFTCALTVAGEPYCWGDNEFGQMGIGQTGGLFPRPVHVAAAGRTFRQVSAGATRTCALNVNRLAFCWGANWYGAVGDGTDVQRTTPVRVARGIAFLDLADGGEYHTCGIALDGRAYCWGLNNGGQVGDGTTINRLKPVAVAGGLLFRQLTAGSEYTLRGDNGSRRVLLGQESRGRTGQRDVERKSQAGTGGRAVTHEGGPAGATQAADLTRKC